jgi:GGDEF domain-containing protein
LETIIWSGMLGGLLTLATLAIADVVMSRSLAAWRGLAYMLLAGSSCVVLSGLPEAVFPNLPALTMAIFKAGLGPLSGAITLTYLGQWLGVAAEDRLVHRTIVWGAAALIAASMFMSGALVMYADKSNESILVLAAWVNCASVLMATFASARAAQLGDTLARWMVVACLLLAISVSGLYTHSLRQTVLHPVIWLITACATVGFFLVVVGLGITRNRLNRRLERLAGLSRGMDPATGLPRGSVLLSKVDDAFWRSTRLDAECVVVCVHLRNLYELSETAGHSIDQQILVAITARIRRAVGFRCVVGLYHPRCFVIVFSAVTQPKVVGRLLERLRYLLAKQLTVVGQNDGNFAFTPQFSFGMVTIDPTGADPATVIDQAERIALGGDSEVEIEVK